MCNSTERKRDWARRNAEANRQRNKDWYRINRAKIRKSRAVKRVAGRVKENARVHRYYDPVRALEYCRARQARILEALPAWADRKAIRAIYAARKAAEELFGIMVQVDHVVPLKSDLVCGLHCEANLELLTGKANAEKHNSFWPDMWI